MTGDSLAAALDAFHFLRPAWLALLPLAWLLHRLLARRHSAEHSWRSVVAAHLLPHLVVNRAAGWRQRLAEPRLTLALLLALAGLALAGPSWQREPPPFVEDRAPLVIALDLGRSMNLPEPAPLGPTRLTRAKQKIRALLTLRRGARSALIVYAGSAHTVLPLTDDTAILASYVEHLRSDLLPVAGKRSATALALAEQLLAAERVPGTVLLVSDGIEAALPAPTEATPARLLWQVGAGETAISGIDTIPVRLDDDDVAEVQRRVQSHLEAANAAAAQTRWVDAGYWLLWPLVLLAALNFRRGWTVRW